MTSRTKCLRHVAYLMMAVLLVVCAVVPVSAAQTRSITPVGGKFTITIDNADDNHTYEALQIFAGTLALEDNGTADTKDDYYLLSDITWGSGVRGADLLAALKADTTTYQINGANAFANVKSAADVADVLSVYGNVDAYLPATGTPSEADQASARIAAQQFADAFAHDVVNYKSVTVAGTSQKVTDESGTTEGTFKYRITNLDAGYYLVKDQMGSQTGTNSFYTGFILNVVGNVTVSPKGYVPAISKQVKEVNDSDPTKPASWSNTADYDIGDDVPFLIQTTSASNYEQYRTYKWELVDTMSAGLSYNNDLKVFYGGDKGVIGTTDITEHFTVSFDATKNQITVSCADLKSIPGHTFDHTTVFHITYTAKLNDMAVVGGNGNENRAFLKYSNSPNFDGTGEPPMGQTPEDNVVIHTYTVKVDKMHKVGTTTELLKGAAFRLEKKDSSGAWVTVKDYKDSFDKEQTSFEFKGLDAGTYRLVESVTPAGYNTIKPIEFDVVATFVGNTCTDVQAMLPGTTTVVTNSENVPMFVDTQIPATATSIASSNGILETDILNKRGTQLPSTGGAGTTAIYTVGTVLMLGAAVLLITKKRMSAVK